MVKIDNKVTSLMEEVFSKYYEEMKQYEDSLKEYYKNKKVSKDENKTQGSKLPTKSKKR